MEAGKAVLNRK